MPPFLKESGGFFYGCEGCSEPGTVFGGVSTRCRGLVPKVVGVLQKFYTFRKK
jgi:hypothetical protein